MLLFLHWMCVVLLSLSLAACKPAPQTLAIVVGSENKALEALVTQLGRQHGVQVAFTYLGSVDIGREIQKGNACTYDAVWPASSLWIALSDTQHVVKHAQSIMRSPVVFAVKKPVAEQLGWLGKELSVRDILTAAETGRVRFAMTSATQSNSGASAYLGYLHAFAGKPDVLTHEHLQAPAVQEQVSHFLGQVHRQTGSSGWLMDLLLERYDQFDAVVNYEALVIETNQKLTAQGRPPLYAFYPVDGLTIADAPLAYIDHSNAAKEKAFLTLQTALLEEKVQRQILQTGRRVGRVGVQLTAADRQIFNPAWGIDVQRLLVPITLPRGDVIREALMLFQTALRKPSLTVYVLDFSGSMQGEGEQQVKTAMRTLLDPDLASQYLLQPSARDRTAVIFFNSRPSPPLVVAGNDPSTMRAVLGQITHKQPGGGTDMYAAVAAALTWLGQYESDLGHYHVAIMVMSDGKSDGKLADTQRHPLSRDVPVYTILFGEADPVQMQELARVTSGRMFDGRKDMIAAFREAKGYN
jgi:Ca-activated chloride channel family protein